MRLRSINIQELAIGKLVVLVTTEANRRCLTLRMIERLENGAVHLEPAHYLMLDDDDVTEVVSLNEAEERLQVPEFENGDRVLFHGKSCSIIKCIPNDLHVYIAPDENPGKEIYTNLIHLDFTPVLDAQE